MRVQLPISTIIALLFIAPAPAQSPLSPAFTYQGQLKEGGVPANGSYDLQFTLWDHASIGTSVAGTIVVANHQIINGLFTITLDFGIVAFNGDARWLQVGVRSGSGVDPDPYTPLIPRQALSATPYALNAAQLGGIAPSEYVTTTSGGNTFIKNGTALQPTSNFNISGTGTAGSLKVNGAASLGGITPPATAPAGQGRIYYDSASNKMKISENSGAFVNLVGASGLSGSGSTNSIPFWSAGTTLGNSLITQSVNGVQLPNGVQLAAGAQGNALNFGSPNGETGLSISGATGRADLRFDGSTLKLFAGPAGGPPSNGIVINTSGGATILGTNGDGAVLTARRSGGDPYVIIDASPASQNAVLAFRKNNFNRWLLYADSSTESGGNAGSDFKLDAYNNSGGIANHFIVKRATGNVGFGIVTPQTRLALGSGTSWTSNLWQGALSMPNASAIGWEANSSGQRFGIGQTNGGLLFFRTSSAFGTTGSPANYDLQIADNGNITQPIAANGLVKAMIAVNYNSSNPTIARCYNGITNSSTGNCGFVLTEPGWGIVRINFGFPVSGRFAAVTARYTTTGTSTNNSGANYREFDATSMEVFTFVAGDSANTSPRSFTIIVY